MTSRRRVDFEDTETFHDEAPDEVSQDAALRQIPQDGQLSVRSTRVKVWPDGTMAYLGCRLERGGMVIEQPLEDEDALAIARILLGMGSQVNVWFGDLLASMTERQYGDIKGIAVLMGRNPKTLSNWKAICSAVTSSRRREVHERWPDRRPLTMGHYSLVMGLPEDEQQRYLSEALELEWSMAQLRAALRIGDADEDVEDEPLEPDIAPVDKVILHLKDIQIILDGMPAEERKIILEMLGDFVASNLYLEQSRLPH